MNRLSKFVDKLINLFLGVTLIAIVIIVFSNVVLRYIFESGIIWGPELSRYLFIWMTFIGAIAALKNNDHIAVNVVTKRLPERMKKIFLLVGNFIMLGVLYFVVTGSWKMTVINKATSSPATGLPLSIIYIPGIILGVSMIVIILFNTYKLLFNMANGEELIPPEQR